VDNPATKTCSECGKTILENQEKWTYTNHEGKKEIFCSSECFAKKKKKKKFLIQKFFFNFL